LEEEADVSPGGGVEGVGGGVVIDVIDDVGDLPLLLLPTTLPSPQS